MLPNIHEYLKERPYSDTEIYVQRVGMSWGKIIYYPVSVGFGFQDLFFVSRMQMKNSTREPLFCIFRDFSP